MKIFGYKLRVFEKKVTTLEAVETWMVEWNSVRGERFLSMPHFNKRCQAFTSYADAKLFESQLKSARKLLQDDNFDTKLYKQDISSNI